MMKLLKAAIVMLTSKGKFPSNLKTIQTEKKAYVTSRVKGHMLLFQLSIRVWQDVVGI